MKPPLSSRRRSTGRCGLSFLLLRLFVCLSCAVSSSFAAKLSLQFDDPTHSVFHDKKFRSLGSRELVFSLSDDAFQAGPQTGGYVQYDEATNSPAPWNGVLGGYGGSIAWSSNRLANSYINVTCPPKDPNGEPHSESGYAFPMSWYYSSNLCVSQKPTIAEDLQDRIAAFGTQGVDYTYSAVNVSAQFRGGPFDGTKTKIKGLLALGVTSARHSGPHDDNWSALGDIFLEIDWGIDPWGGHEYFLFQISMSAAASTSDFDCLPLNTVYTQLLGMDPESYLRGIQQDIQSQVQSGALHIEGPVPELLYLYDFSGKYTVPPLTTVPPSALFPSDFDGYTNFPGFVNQYDAGVAFSLPVRFKNPNPVSNNCTPGGNACGPTSLMMALNAFGAAAITDEKPIFKNSMENGLLYGSCSDGNSFSASKAQDWLLGSNSWNGVTLDPPPVTAVAGVLYADTEQSANSMSRGWSIIDQMLRSKKHPIVFRTSLGFGSAPGGGHMILLLGKGHSDDIGQVWGDAYESQLSGDYYIVADPAGHFCSNIDGQHYNLVDNLRTIGTGVVYGGWCAIYPAELFTSRTFDHLTRITRNIDGTKSTNKVDGDRLTALAVGQAFGPRLWLRVHSPVTLMVTDSLGRRTGIDTDGVYFSEIPDSVFVPDISDEEEEGTTTVDPSGPKSVFIDNPAGGTYQVTLIGTGAGPYTFDWHHIGADGQTLDGETLAGTATPGAQRNYTINLPATEGPALHISAQTSSFTVSWPANAAGFALETATNLIASDSWQPVAAQVNVIGGQNTVALPISGVSQFLRLKRP